MKVTPLGAAGTVTGSRFLVEGGGVRILVDCGLFQGLKALRLRNWRPFPIDPAGVDALILTHAHLDHSGFLPALVRDGFRGRIHLTPPTADLLPILLEDAGRLQEEDARWARKKGFSRHAEPRALFTEADARAVLPFLERVPFGEVRPVGGGLLRMQRSGHILGAASVELWIEGGRRLLFSGDLGRREDPLLPAPPPRPEADLVFMESTYGDRAHPEGTAEERMSALLRETISRGGVTLFASFAVGRAQTLALLIHRLMERGEVPEVPVFLNSPMAIEVTEQHLNHRAELRPVGGEFEAAIRRLVPTATVEESKALHRRRGPMIIIAGAGMLTGGRILHHLLAFGDEDRHLLILPGYQAEGTRGRELRRGGRIIRIHGRSIELRCRIETMDELSGHADQGELLEWIGGGVEPREGVVLVHGEPGPADALRREIQWRTGWAASVAEEGRSYP